MSFHRSPQAISLEEMGSDAALSHRIGCEDSQVVVIKICALIKVESLLFAVIKICTLIKVESLLFAVIKEERLSFWY